MTKFARCRFRQLLLGLLLALVACLDLAGCASGQGATGQGAPKADLVTDSDEPENRKRARILSDAGIVTTIRKTRGDDIEAACGQLAGDVRDRTGVAGRVAQQRTIMLKPAAPVAGGHKEV